MDTLLQIWGGSTVVLNKVFLAKGGPNRQRWVAIGWMWFLAAMPAWLAIFIIHHDWIAAALEAGAVPAALIGLRTARGGQTSTVWRRSVDGFTAVMVALGLGYSAYDHGGITSITQLLEMAAVAGYLVGANQMAKEKRSGWIWFGVMNAATALLMAVQAKWGMAAAQFVSLLFVLWGYVHWRPKSTPDP
ncbi:MAG: hypothetical protein WC935_07010 [Thermoleophilia bacterium]